MSRVGFAMELEPVGYSQTLLIFAFYQRSRGISGWLMNPLIGIMQSRGGRAGPASLKHLAEHPDTPWPFLPSRGRVRS